ncbi:DUF2442 domain-containing protein [Pleomorphovibrio marinus]|uniref:DUF2442 domain-containing protein n=1 Tax=Pleomorphovibrio marinus TaxID=2164132 RepID=UPI000E0BC3AA|nr:DUF2442 domain-containing protein [Pleomorphovibrio marinus]
MIYSIKEIVDVEPYRVTLRFNTEEIRTVDLTENLNELGSNPISKFAELKDPSTFKKVKLDEEFDTVVWENGIDLCPDVLYQMSTGKAIKNKV